MITIGDHPVCANRMSLSVFGRLRRNFGSSARAVLSSLLLLAIVATSAVAEAPWWNTQWHFRVPVTFDVGAYARQDHTAEVRLNFTQLVASTGQSGTLDLNSIRVVEVDSTGILLDDSVDVQFDRDLDFHPSAKASGTLVVFLEGETSAGVARHFHVYFDLVGGSFQLLPVASQVTLTDNILDEDQLCFRVTTVAGTYFYHKMGAGFSSFLDNQGNDWIGYHPSYAGSTAGGPSRGMPNCVYPRGYFHPGFTSSASTVESQGPLKITVRSQTLNDDWSCRWEFFPQFARFTILGGDSTYWMLYEGTPGGKLDVSSDIVVRSDGTQSLASQSWTGDIPGEEWVYFGDPARRRSIFVAHHEEDDIPDSYRPMDSLMTVFGFGRQNTNSYLMDFPQHMTVGLIETLDFTTAAGLIRGAYKPLTVTVGAAEANTRPGTVTLDEPADGTVTVAGEIDLRWHPSPLSILYGIQVATDSTFASGLVVHDSTVADTVRRLPEIVPSTRYFWRVYGRNATGRGPYSEVWHFSTGGTAPAAVSLVAPQNGSATISDSVKFVWNRATPSAQRYWFELGYDEGFLFKVDDSTLTDTVKVVTTLLKNSQHYWRVKAANGLGWGPYSDTWTFSTSLTAVEGEKEVPQEMSLFQNYPNPFNGETEIRYVVSSGLGEGGQRASVSLKVFDLLGRLIADLVHEDQSPGQYAVRFTPQNLAGGVYVYRLDVQSRDGQRSGAFSSAKFLLLLK